MHDVRLQGICTIFLNCLSTLQWQIQGRARGGAPALPRLFLDQTEARRAEKIWRETSSPPPPSYLRVSMTASALSQVWIRHYISPHLEGNSILDILCSLVRAWTMWFTSIFCYVTLPWQQYIWISQNRGPAKMAEKTKKLTCMTFLRMTALRN